MEQETGGDVAGAGEGSPAPTTEPESKLPSDVAEQKPSFSTELPEELASRVDENGMLDGKYKSVEDVLNALKEIKDKHANLSREQIDAQKQQEADVDAVAQELQLEQKRTSVIESLVPEFMANGMQVTPEMEAQLEETGLTKTEIELGAYKFKETIAKHQSYVGGEENYNKIMDYHAQNMTDEQKIAFNHSISSGEHSEALLIGLQTMYEKQTGVSSEPVNTDRIRGNASPAGIKPYTTRQELFRDKAYIDSPAGKRDAGAIKRYKEKLAVTPDSVWKK